MKQLTKESVQEFLKEAVNGLLQSDDGRHYFFKIPRPNEDCPDLKIVVTWEDGFDQRDADKNPFQEEHYVICASLRIDDRQYFNDDSYMINESYSFDATDKDDDFARAALSIFDDIDDYSKACQRPEFLRVSKSNGHNVYLAQWSDDESGYMYDPITCKLVAKEDTRMTDDLYNKLEQEIVLYVKEHGKKGAEDCELYIDLTENFDVFHDGLWTAYQVSFFAEEDVDLIQVYCLTTDNSGTFFDLDSIPEDSFIRLHKMLIGEKE